MGELYGIKFSRANVGTSVMTSLPSGTDSYERCTVILADSVDYCANLKDVFGADDRAQFYFYKPSLDRSSWTLLGGPYTVDGGSASPVITMSGSESSPRFSSNYWHNHSERAVHTWRFLMTVPWGDNKITFNSLNAYGNNGDDGHIAYGSYEQKIYRWDEMRVYDSALSTLAPSSFGNTTHFGLGSKLVVSFGGYL